MMHLVGQIAVWIVVGVGAVALALLVAGLILDAATPIRYRGASSYRRDERMN